MSSVIETEEQAATRPERRPTGRSVLMCRPEHFTVVYRINPWMNPAQPTDTSLAVQQWQVLYDTYRAKLDGVIASLKEWEAVTLATDFPPGE